MSPVRNNKKYIQIRKPGRLQALKRAESSAVIAPPRRSRAKLIVSGEVVACHATSTCGSIPCLFSIVPVGTHC